MIAAIASCIFVIYLYRSLNEGEVEAQSPETANEGELAERLAALETRLRALTEEQPGGASS